jgi:hypothetical protein
MSFLSTLGAAKGIMGNGLFGYWGPNEEIFAT